LNSDHFTNVLSGQGVNDIFDIAFSPKASLMAGVGAGGAVRLWNLERPTTPPVNLPIRNVGSVAFSPDGRALAVAGCSTADDCVEGEVHVISLDEPESAPIVFVIPEVWVTSVAYSPDGQTLAAGSIDGSVRLWSLGEPRSPPRVFIGSPYTVTSVAFSPDGRTLAAGGCGSSPNMGDCSQGAVRLIAIDRTAADPVDLPADHGPMHSVTFTQDGRWLIAAARRESGVHLWQLANPGAPPTSLAGPPGGVATMALSQDGRTLAVGGCGAAQLYGECIGGEARLFDLANLGAAPIVLTGLGKSVTSVTFSADGAWLATSGCRQWTNRVSECAEFEIRLIRLGRSAASPVTLDRAAERSDLMGFSPIGHIVTQSVDDAKLRQWDPDQPETPVSDLGDRLMFGMASNIAFSPDGQLLAWGSHVGVVFIWEPARSTTDPVVLRDRRRPEVNIIRDLVFGPDGRMLAGLDESHAVLWDVTQPTIAASELPLPANWHGELAELALGEEGTRLTAIGIEDGAIAVMRWDVPTPASGPTALMRLAADGLQVLTLSSDGQLLAASNESGAVVLWDLRQPEPSPVLLAVPPAAPSALAFDPSGALLAVGTADGSVLLLRLDQPDTPAVSLTVSDYPVSRVAFSPDGQHLATDAADAVRLWLVSTDALAEIVCDQVLRNLTLAEWQQYVEPGNTYQRTCPNLPPGEGAPPDPAFSAATPHPSGPS
jgi:WD40 repeat protein